MSYIKRLMGCKIKADRLLEETALLGDHLVTATDGVRGAGN